MIQPGRAILSLNSTGSPDAVTKLQIPLKNQKCRAEDPPLQLPDGTSLDALLMLWALENSVHGDGRWHALDPLRASRAAGQVLVSRINGQVPSPSAQMSL